MAPLPEPGLSKLSKDLRKLVDDPKVPIRGDQTVSDVKLKKYFLAFFIRMFKNYQRFMVRASFVRFSLEMCVFELAFSPVFDVIDHSQEAPDNAVTEKFQKENFLADLGLKSDSFMQQFTNAQLFQWYEQ